MSVGAGSRQVLTFRARGGTYGIDLDRAREIVRFTGPCPSGAGCVRGNIEHRGGRLALVDLAVKLRGPATAATGRTCVVVAEAAGLGLGLLVDEIGAVIELAPGDVGVPPRLGPGLWADFLVGVADAGGQLVLILDLDRLLEPEERVAAAGACGVGEVRV